MRWDPPAQVSARQATADISIGTTIIRKGDNIGLMIGAANRDKRRWPDADQLHLDRPNPQPVSFGFGAHHCLGAALARMELRTVLPLLLDRLGDYEVDLANTSWKRSFALRGPTKLPLTAGRRHTVPRGIPQRNSSGDPKSCAVQVGACTNVEDGDDVAVLVDAVPDPISASSIDRLAIEWRTQRLAELSRVVSQRTGQ